MPNVLWIWSTQELKLCAVLIQDSPIKCRLITYEIYKTTKHPLILMFKEDNLSLTVAKS